MINSHYVSMQTLRRFGNKLCVFNVQTGEYFENINVDKLFSEKGFYTSEVEDKLNKRIESQFGNLFANKLMKCEETVELSREELHLIKKFLLISVIRSLGNEKFMQSERHFYENLQAHWLSFANEKGILLEEAKKNMPQAPFEEKIIEGESSYDYWMRTLNVILDSDGTPQDILKHPNKTYPAHRWAEVINNGYIAFWDSEFNRDEYVVTDIGMTSENEKGWNGVTVHNRKKTDFLNGLLANEKDDMMKINIFDKRFKDQLWAEAKHYYDSGEELYLKGEFLDAATEIQVQGLELDYTCLLWDADMRYKNGQWEFYHFNGQTKWIKQEPNTESKAEQLKYMLNAYRVLLTRARAGMVVCVPAGNPNRTPTGFWEDSTRLLEFYDETYQYLKSL